MNEKNKGIGGDWFVDMLNEHLLPVQEKYDMYLQINFHIEAVNDRVLTAAINVGKPKGFFRPKKENGRSLVYTIRNTIQSRLSEFVDCEIFEAIYSNIVAGVKNKVYSIAYHPKVGGIYEQIEGFDKLNEEDEWGLFGGGK
jgi:hypothetical protein